MISRELPPITIPRGFSLDVIGEALAFTYLSQYSTASIGPRPQEAYKRAWGFDRLLWFPRGVVDPGFLVALWDAPKFKRAVVAIEGTSSFGQIAPLIDVSNVRTNPAFASGSVIALFNDRASSVHTKLLASAQVAAAIADGGYDFTFTGHSLGAAMADILAARFQFENRGRRIRCVKIGSPRVGSSRYVRRTTNVADLVSIYADADPIWRYPRNGVWTPLLLTALSKILGAETVNEENRLLISRFGSAFGSEGFPVNDGWQDPINLAHLSRAVNLSNRWFCHLLKTYRLWFMTVAHNADPMLAYRFNYLEHPDENAWQSRWSPQQRDWAILDELLVVTPADAPPPTPGVVATINRGEQSGASGGGDWAAAPDAMGARAQALFGTVAPREATAQLPRRRFTRPAP